MVKRVMKGCGLTEYRLMASGAPCVVPSDDLSSFPSITNNLAGAL